MGSTGTPAPQASPCATEQAVRRPVNEPGPRPKAMALKSLSDRPACASKACTAGIKLADACAPPAPVWAKRWPSARCTATDS